MRDEFRDNEGIMKEKDGRITGEIMLLHHRVPWEEYREGCRGHH